ncbi:FCD domain-containing protein [bacterium]|nr:FCD domain-containing protein [bacterium]
MDNSEHLSAIASTPRQQIPADLASLLYRTQVGESLNETAYQRIRDMIVHLELPPASVIDEAKLTVELELGLTPIRQALRRLAMENLVVILPRRGTLVADLNMDNLQKIFEIRLELETLAARLAAERATTAQIAEMEQLLSPEILAHAEKWGESRNELLIRIDQRAHVLLAEATHNEILADTLDSLYSHVLRLWYVNLSQVKALDDALVEHRQIVAAVAVGDGESAQAIMRKHISSFQDEVLNQL